MCLDNTWDLYFLSVPFLVSLFFIDSSIDYQDISRTIYQLYASNNNYPLSTTLYTLDIHSTGKEII